MTRLSKDADFTCFDTVGLPAEQQALLPEAALHTSSVRIEPFVVLVLVVVLVVLVLVAAAVGVVLVVLVLVGHYQKHQKRHQRSAALSP